jgi:hypothetical protein
MPPKRVIPPKPAQARGIPYNLHQTNMPREEDRLRLARRLSGHVSRNHCTKKASATINAADQVYSM